MRKSEELKGPTPDRDAFPKNIPKALIDLILRSSRVVEYGKPVFVGEKDSHKILGMCTVSPEDAVGHVPVRSSKKYTWNL